MASLEIAWLAGLLEGDGSFEMSKTSSKTWVPRIRLAMLDKDIIERVSLIFQSNISTYKTPKGDKLMYRVTTAKTDVLKPLLEQMYPFLGERRKQQVDLMLNYYSNKENTLQEVSHR